MACAYSTLIESERQKLQEMLSGGEQAVRRVKRAQILLASDLDRFRFPPPPPRQSLWFQDE
jgi:hypothetical protein